MRACHLLSFLLTSSCTGPKISTYMSLAYIPEDMMQGNLHKELQEKELQGDGLW